MPVPENQSFPPLKRLRLLTSEIETAKVNINLNLQEQS